jgi:hypothetical protein
MVMHDSIGATPFRNAQPSGNSPNSVPAAPRLGMAYQDVSALSGSERKSAADSIQEFADRHHRQVYRWQV